MYGVVETNVTFSLKEKKALEIEYERAQYLPPGQQLLGQLTTPPPPTTPPRVVNLGVVILEDGCRGGICPGVSCPRG